MLYNNKKGGCEYENTQNRRYNRHFQEGGGAPLSYKNKYIYTDSEGDEIINEQLCKNEPCLIARFSTVEYTTVREFVRNKKNRKIDIFSHHQRYSMANNAGFFPTTNKALTRFACELIDLSSRIDIFACWYWPFEKEVCEKYLPNNAKLVHIENISPFNSQTPWTLQLEGKKILVIYSHENIIKTQYAKRELLHKNKNILPQFELITMEPVQTIAENKSLYNYSTWFNALNDMKKQIKHIDFDIALIGAGAYGIFLADYCKQIGKIGINTGGVTQLLFGIKGKRWDCYNLYNEHWVKLPESEIPLGAEKVEDGCYW